MTRRGWIGLLFAVAAVACTGSPQPIPPPKVEALTLEVGDDRTTIRGGPGSIDDRADAVVILNFAFQSGALFHDAVSVSPDGSFAQDLPGALPSDEIRLQPIVEATFERSAPLDVSGDLDGVLGPLPDAGCLTLDRTDLELEVSVGDVARDVVEVHNGCGTDLPMLSATNRFSSGRWTAEGDDAAPFMLADGETRRYTVVFSPLTVGPDYGAFVVKVEIPAEVHAVTLLGRGL